MRARLGPYVGLFYALRAKHPPSAAHCLRVALGCSKWATFCSLPSESRDTLELAGLLHDLGKIGVPDLILQKPSQLNRDELHAMDLTTSHSLEILHGVGADHTLLQAIEQARYTFDSGRAGCPLARMLQIVDAFDSMTTVQVFRAAFSREQALDELFAHAGTQFDPELVTNFSELINQPRPELESLIAQRWLSQLSKESHQSFTGAVLVGSAAEESLVNTLFHQRLLDSLTDAAVYLDNQGKILHWNRAAEQLSGRTSESVQYCQWNPTLMGLLCEAGQPIQSENCPLQLALKTNTQHVVRLTAVHANGRQSLVQFTAIPLFTSDGSFAGFILLIRDASLQSDLEMKVRALHAIATQDPLTKVANRAELNRSLEQFVIEHSATGTPGSVIMCDIDFFKRINDSYSHQAGDQALITFANLLRDHARRDDLVARYGGEEFVILCDSCDIQAAHAQAEKLRHIVSSTPVPSLKGKTMTSSFGVTQLQQGDDAETFMARADRALMTAKETGRNRVVQLGGNRLELQIKLPEESITTEASQSNQKSGWLNWFIGQNRPLAKREYLTAVPMEIAAQKLQGFVRDHRAEILSAHGERISIRVKSMESARRRGEHAVALLMNIKIQNVKYCSNGRNTVYQDRTLMLVTMHPVKSRDRRLSSLEGQAQQVLLSFQAYMVAEEVDDELRPSIIKPR
ncbi:MAG: diguanylate cyclase [Pirellulaceae bacterium]|nr:diguanylate cyclase [Pirellulaceae bacterium]